MQKVMSVFFMLATFLIVSCNKDDSNVGPSGTPAVPSSSAIDISHNGTGGYTFGLHGADQLKRFQTFKADPAYLNITGVDIKIRRNSALAAYNNVTVELYETASNVPTNLLAVSSINIDSLGTNFTVLNAPLKYSGLTAGHTYAIVLGQSNVMVQTNSGFEWCTSNVDTSLNFGKYNGTGWVSEPGLGDGWLKVYVDKTVRTNEYAFSAGEQVVFFDDFQRTIGRIGNNWTERYGSQDDTSLFDIYNEGGGNKVARIKSAGIVANGDTNWTDYTLSVKVKSTDLNSYISLRFRYPNSMNVYDFSFWHNSKTILEKYVSGWSNLAEDSISTSINTYYKMKVVVHGNNIKAYFDNLSSPIIDYTDAAPITNGRIALCLFTNDQLVFDDVLVTVP
jgi:hypothetical protein